MLNCILKFLTNHDSSILNKLHILDLAALPILFHMFVEQTKTNQLFHDQYMILVMFASHGGMKPSFFRRKCKMCQAVTSHELSYPVEVMQFYCKHCHNSSVINITWKRSSPVQPQAVTSKFLGLLHVMGNKFKFNFGFKVFFDSKSCSLVAVFKMEK